MKRTIFALILTLMIITAAADNTADIMTTLPANPVLRVMPAEVKVTVAIDTWQLCIPVAFTEAVTVRYVSAPATVTCPQTGASIYFEYTEDMLTLESSDIPVDGSCRNAVVQWPESRWEKDMQKFVEANKAMPPMADGILFTGSSTARMWNVKKSFPDIHTLNRGFGGSQYWDLFQFADCILGEHRPETIVIYSGDNDINAKKSPEWVFADCAAAVQRVHALAPESRIIILGAKPSGSRWDQYPAMQQANALIEDYTLGLDEVYFLDLGYLLLDADGKPSPDCFLKDALHMNEKGYRLWSDSLMAFMAKMPG